MKEKTHSLILTLVFLVLVSFVTNAQNDFGSEKELRKQADGLFEVDDYAAALPLYSQLLSLYPKDPNFNYKYGVCLLYAKENKEKPLPYLTFAIGKNDVDDDIYYHLGKAFHLNYRFDEAIAQYNIFKLKKSKSSTKLEVDLQIKQCQSGKTLLKNVTDLTVIEKKELNSTEYFRAYDLAKIGAKLVVKPDDLKTSFDVKKKDQSTVVIRQTSQDIYYSSYGSDGKNGRDIYKISKQENFTWGKPVNLGPNVNTMYDEDFPFITPDGKTLYFCSKGHNSMGGYDIFKSELNASGEWSVAKNLDFAINTPDDDIQYVTDPQSDFAYFSSKRNSAEGKIIVFKVKLERVPVTAAIIKGKVTNDAIPSNLAAKISIKNVQTGMFIGTFNSADKDGKYRMNLNNGTKYEYTVEQSGTPPITQIVDIPVMTELRPLKQEIQLRKKDGVTTMIIYNFFGDTVENNALAIAELFKERANLDVNYDEQVQAGIINEASAKNTYDSKVLSNRNTFKEESTTASNTEPAKGTAAEENKSANKNEKGINNTEIVAIAAEDAKEMQKDADDTRDKSRQAFAFSNLKNNQAQNKYKEASKFENDAAAANEISEKQLQLDFAAKAKKDGDLLSQQAVVAYNLAKDLELEADAKQAEANQAQQYASDLELAVKSDSKSVLENLEKQSKELEKNKGTSKVSSPENLTKLAKDKNAEAVSLEARKNDLKAEIQESMFDEKIAREEVLKSKTDAVKETKEAQLNTVLAARKDKETELGGIDNKIVKLKEEAIALEDEARINKEILAEISTAGNTNLTQIAAEDKQKLEEQFSAQRSENNSSTNTSADANQTAKTKESNLPKADKANTNIALEDYTNYTNSLDENKKDFLLAQANQANQMADSSAKLLSNTTEKNEMNSLAESQKSFQEIANSKKVAANLIAYNIYNKEYEANKNVLNQKLQSLPETDKANFSNSLSQIEGDYLKAVTAKDNAIQQNTLAEKETNLNAAVNAQNVVLVRQRKLLEQANSSIANNNVDNKVTANFKGFNTDRNSSVTEAVNNLRPDYSNYSTTLKVSSEETATIKKSQEYIQFETILNQARSFEDNADKNATEFTAKKAIGEEKVIESQGLIDLAAEEKKKSKKQALAEEAIRIDNEGRDMLITADAIKIKAQSEMLKAAAVKSEADKFIATLDKAQQEKIIAVYKKQEIQNNPEIAVTKQDVVAGSNDVTKETAKESNTSINVNEQKEAPKNNQTQVNQTEVKADNLGNQNEAQASNNVVATSAPKIKDKESVLKEIKSTTDYQGYEAIKNEAAALKISAVEKRNQADSIKVQAQKDAISSNELFEFAAAQSRKKNKVEAQKKAEELDRVSKANEAKVDSLNAVADKSETDARAKQFEADNYLKKFDEPKSKILLMAYNNVVPEELLKATETNNEVAKNVNPIANTASANASQNTTKEQNNIANQNQQKQNKELAQSNSNANLNKENKSDNLNQKNKQENSNLGNEEEKVVTSNQTATTPVIQATATRPSVKTTDEYLKFVGLKKEAEQAAADAIKLKQNADSVKTLSSQKLEESNNKLDEAASLNKRKRKPLVQEAYDLDYESQLLSRSADSLNASANEANKQSLYKNNAADIYLSSIDKKIALRIMRAIEGIPEPIETIETETVVSTNSNNNNVVSTNTESAKTNQLVPMGINKGKPHNSNNPIKMNEALPDGLVFKVQIGAFNRPVVENAFGSLSPISGEIIPNSKLIRYTAGLFNSFEGAASARKELITLNYKDAFVVAYCYGKRMPLSEARALLAAGKDCKSGGVNSSTQNALAANNNLNNTASNNSSNQKTTSDNLNSLANNNNTAPAQIKVGETLPQQDIQTIKGLMYTVQVGVYSKAVKAGQLYNITPLYYELNQKGQYRYTSGIFNEVREAAKAKDVIVQIGVADAFVSAYINGKRIPMEQAAAMEAQQGKSIFTNAQGLNVQPKVIPLEGATEQNKTAVEVPKTIANSTANNVAANVVYKVQLGAFRKEVPVEIMNKYLSIADKGIANFKNGDLTIYTVGNYKDAAAAEAVKAEVIAKGITDAFIIALNNGEKISIDEAKKLNGK